MTARRFSFSIASLLAVGSMTLAQGTTPPAAPATPPAAPAKPAANLPSAESLLAKELAARGGKEAHEAVKHMTSKGTMEFQGIGLKAETTTKLSENGKFLMTVSLAKGSDVLTGFDGTTGWSIDPTMGPRVLEGKELEQLQMDASFARQSSIATQFDKATVVGETTWHDKPAYEMLLKSKDREATIYLDKESSLITGMKMTAETVRGSTPMVATVLEFKAFDGPKGKVTMPTKTEMKLMGMVNIVTIDSVDFSPIDAAVFELPPAIKALVANPAAAPAGTKEPAPNSPKEPAKAPAKEPTKEPAKEPAKPVSPEKPAAAPK